jgi:hypothetical protein
MSGKKGRSGRRRGRLSFTPTKLAGHHLAVFIDMWLAGVPIGAGDHYILPPTKRRYTVPKRIKRALAVFAIEHLAAIDPNWRRPNIDGVIAWTRRRAPKNTLRRRRRSGLWHWVFSLSQNSART